MGHTELVKTFQISVSDVDWSDLRTRLGRVRLPLSAAAEPWGEGVDLSYLANLLDEWSRFDWRAAEERLNAFPQHIAHVQGSRIHFVHLRAARSQGLVNAIPIVLSHGWPYSFVEMLPLAELLAEVGFDVVVPSLPGFGYSEALNEPFTSTAVASRWHELMTDVLGYSRYATYGEDVGSRISDRLAAVYPEAVIGLFVTHAALPPADRAHDLTMEERDFIDWLDKKWEGATGYAIEQATRPDTLAAGLSDSPSGLAAWMVEKYREWSGDDDISAWWTVGELLTTISLYWFTNSIGATFRPYFDRRLEPPMPKIYAPTGISIQFDESGFPRHYAERTYRDIRFWQPLPAGGHFTAKQTPEMLADRMLAFYSGLPSSN